MNFERMRDVLDHARDFHTELSRHFTTLNSVEQQARVRLLLGYLSRHESHMAEVIRQFEENASEKVLETWFQYTANLNADAEKLQVHPNLALEDVIDRASHFDDCLIDLYQTMAQEADLPDIREVCEKLLQMEEEERHGRTRSMVGLQQDM